MINACTTIDMRYNNATSANYITGTKNRRLWQCACDRTQAISAIITVMNITLDTMTRSFCQYFYHLSDVAEETKKQTRRKFQRSKSRMNVRRDRKGNKVIPTVKMAQANSNGAKEILTTGDSPIEFHFGI